MSETISSGITITIPTLGEQNWSESIKSSCFTPISAHDHTGSGNGVQLGANALQSNAVTEAKIANGAVTAAKLATAVTATLVPTGSLLMWAAAAAPTGYLLCDGAAVSRTTYSGLFSVISDTYGVGDGSTTFNLPDLRQRFPIGKAASGTGSTLGGTGGNIDHTHSTPAHYHSMGTGADLNIASSGSHTHNVTDPGHTHVQGASNLTGGSNKRPDYNSDRISDGVVLDQSTNSATTGLTVDAASHTHTSGNFAGKIGLVTGGVDGNAAMTSGTANPPFQAVNFIIKT